MLRARAQQRARRSHHGDLGAPPEDFLSALDAEMGIKAPRKAGYDAVRSLHALHEGRAKVFFAISGNLLAAAPDTHFTTEAFKRCPLVVHVSTKLHRGHLLGGEEALILPCLGRAERVFHHGKQQLSSAEDSMGIVNPTRGDEEPIANSLLNDTEIIVRVAQATFGPGGPVDWESLLDHDRVRDHISRIIPGFEDFDARLRRGFFYLPNAAKERTFNTQTGKAQFTACPLPKHDLQPGELIMTTVRSHDQFNTVVYGLDDRYRGVWGGRRVIFLNPADLKELGLVDGQLVDITSHFQGETRTVFRFRTVSYPIARKSAAAYYPETNPLVAIGAVDPSCNQPAHKCVRITLEASKVDDQG